MRKLDNNWYEGRLNHIQGIFPGDYVEILREPKGKYWFLNFIFIRLKILDNSLKQSNQNENITKMPKSVLKNSTGLQQTSVEKINLVPGLTLPQQK